MPIFWFRYLLDKNMFDIGIRLQFHRLKRLCNELRRIERRSYDRHQWRLVWHRSVLPGGVPENQIADRTSMTSTRNGDISINLARFCRRTSSEGFNTPNLFDEADRKGEATSIRRVDSPAYRSLRPVWTGLLEVTRGVSCSVTF